MPKEYYDLEFLIIIDKKTYNLYPIRTEPSDN